MQLFTLLWSESPQALRFIALLTFVAGAANAALVALINAGASATYNSTAATREFLVFVFCLLLFCYGKMGAEMQGKQLIEKAMTSQRLRIFERLLQSRVYTIESLSQGEIISKTSRNIGQVLQATDTIIYGMQSMFMLTFCALYLLWISPAAFAAVFGGVVVMALVRYTRNEDNRTALNELIAREGDQSRFLSDLIDGFKELKINAKRREALNRAYQDLVEQTSAMGIKTTISFVRSRIVMQATFYSILAVIVFIIPRFTSIYSFQVMEITAVVLFIIGYLAGFLEIIPVLARTNAALKNMSDLRAQLDAEAESQSSDPGEGGGCFDGFQRLAMRDLCYSYTAPDGSADFSVGPLNLEVTRGETLFIVGGNGSGKTTMIKLLTGLYQANAGRLEVDGTAVTDSNIGHLRSLYSIILTDFHLFQQLYGFEQVDEDRVNQLIKLMHLEEKVSFRNGAFSTQKLSTGQRKRLALVVALLDDREIYVFDEWAADQDQHFRKFFYEEMLADLKRAGKTIIAVTHDEMYWDCADRVIRLDYGKIVPGDVRGHSAEHNNLELSH